jgi:hypothetical protein
VAEWQTRMVQDHVLARVWRFNSSLRHQVGNILAQRMTHEARRETDQPHGFSFFGDRHWPAAVPFLPAEQLPSCDAQVVVELV